MAGYEVSVGTELLPGLLTGQDGLAKLVETVLNQVLEAQVTETLGAQRHERTDDRAGYRNGYRPRTLYTRVGPVTLLVPQTRDGSFSTDIFKRYQRIRRSPEDSRAWNRNRSACPDNGRPTPAARRATQRWRR